MVLIKKDLAASTLAEFIAHAKANPGKVTIGHSGIGSQNYLFCKTFIQAAGINVTMVGYRGGGPALNDLISGQIDAVCDSSSSATPAILGGLVKGVALASPARLASLPNVPTAAEAGLPEFQIQGWYALFAPKNTPAPVIATAECRAAQGRHQRRLSEEAGRARLVCRAGQRDHARVSEGFRAARDREVQRPDRRRQVAVARTLR